MTLSPWMGYAVGTVLIGALSRLWVRFKNDRRARKEFAAPLFDSFLLDVALTPRDRDGDDADILSEMKSTLSHLNRQSFAPEIWTLHRQLIAYYDRIPFGSRPTMRRALLRLVSSGNRWLQIVGAKTCAELGVAEAIEPLTGLLAVEASGGDEKSSAVDQRFVQEIGDCLRQLQQRAGSFEDCGSKASSE